MESYEGGGWGGWHELLTPCATGTPCSVLSSVNGGKGVQMVDLTQSTCQAQCLISAIMCPWASHKRAHIARSGFPAAPVKKNMGENNSSFLGGTRSQQLYGGKTSPWHRGSGLGCGLLTELTPPSYCHSLVYCHPVNAMGGSKSCVGEPGLSFLASETKVKR